MSKDAIFQQPLNVHQRPPYSIRNRGIQHDLIEFRSEPLTAQNFSVSPIVESITTIAMLMRPSKLLRIIVLAAGPVLVSWQAFGEAVETARVLPNNAVEIDGEKRVLYGAVVPVSTEKCVADEKLWPCGARATLRLHSMLQSRPLDCGPFESTAELPLVRCRTAQFDIAEQMIAEGLALVPLENPTYASIEESAKSREAGIWRDEFLPPDLWRVYPATKFDPIADLLCSDCAARRFD